MLPADEQRFLRLLRVLLSRLNDSIIRIDDLCAALRQQSDSISNNTEAQKEATKQQARRPPLVSPIVVDLKKHITATIQGKTKTETKNSWDWRDWIRLGAELVGLGVLIWYASTTRDLWKESRKQTVANNTQLHLSQRAVLVITAAGNEGENGRKLQLFIQNQGNSPGTITIIQGACRQVRKDNTLAITPVTVKSIAADSQPISRETSRYMITVDLPVLTADEEHRISTKELAESVFGDITYDAGFGQAFVTNFCATRDATNIHWSDQHCAVIANAVSQLT